MNGKERKALRDEVRDRLSELSRQASDAKRLRVEGDEICDVLDDIDNAVQEVITLVKRLREGEVI
jgi:hypothetical protein